MSEGLYSPRIVQVAAMQLIVVSDPRFDNAESFAQWCGGVAHWEYNAQEMGIDVLAIWITLEDNTNIVRPTDWVVRQENGTFEVLTDFDFCKRYDSQKFEGTPSCRYCLSDPRHTPQGDPGEKRCPLCECRYSGPNRNNEYDALVLAGLVAKEND